MRACRDAGSGHEDEFVVDADVVRSVVSPCDRSVSRVRPELIMCAQSGRSEAEHEYVRQDGVWREAIALAWWLVAVLLHCELSSIRG